MTTDQMLLRKLINRIMDWSPQYRRPVKTLIELPKSPGRFTGVYVEMDDDIYLWHPDLDDCWYSSSRFKEIVDKRFAEEQYLRECPYCHSDEEVEITHEYGIMRFSSYAGHVCCKKCNAHGPIRPTLSESILDWNEVSLRSKTIL